MPLCCLLPHRTENDVEICTPEWLGAFTLRVGFRMIRATFGCFGVMSDIRTDMMNPARLVHSEELAMLPRVSRDSRLRFFEHEEIENV